MLKDEEEKGHKYNSDGEDTLKSQREFELFELVTIASLPAELIMWVLRQ